MRVGAWMVVLAAACGGGADEVPEDTRGSACGSPTYGIAMTFTGLVVQPNGSGMTGVTVVLEDRSVMPPDELGFATSTDGGAFTLQTNDVTSWPDCWLTLLDYTVVGRLTTARGERYEGEVDVNRLMWESIEDGSYDVDLTEKPLQLALIDEG